MSDTTSLQLAAESYVKDRLTAYPFPDDANQFRLLLEIAFMRGAEYQAQSRREAIKDVIHDLQDMREEIENARS